MNTFDKFFAVPPQPFWPSFGTHDISKERQSPHSRANNVHGHDRAIRQGGFVIQKRALHDIANDFWIDFVSTNLNNTRCLCSKARMNRTESQIVRENHRAIERCPVEQRIIISV